MEPWHFSHGEMLAQELLGEVEGLQWSHGILAMESNRETVCSLVAGSASMEPWHFSHGEFPSVRQSWREPVGFNGAMAF